VARPPAWKDDFPVSWTDDHFVTRREFTKSLVFVSCASFGATAALAAKDALSRGGAPPPPLRLGFLADVPVGGARAFGYPDPDTPCLVLRPRADELVAFGQRCTHLGCPVFYEAERARLACPCHEGYFDARDGRVLAGPPPRPLPRVALEVRGEELWAVGTLP
jgi:nitrite reductase/ring-hydroxylating ferredoxin subunit